MTALTGTFATDFTSFYDAVNKAEAELKDFDSGAAKVSKTLSSMADSLSGRKMIQDATLMAEAVEQIGGASKLTEAELARLGAQAAEAVEKMQAMGIKNIPENLQALATATGDVSKQSESAGVSVGTLVQSYLTAEAAVKLLEAAYEVLVGTMEDAIAAAADAEEQDMKVLAALKAQGTAVPSVITAYDDYAKALQRTTIYSDDAVKASEALLITVGGVMPKDMEKALLATTNLAAGLGKDLPEAAMLVAKAAEGNTESLQKYGVQVVSASGETKTFEDVLTSINSRFADNAEMMGNTSAGAVKKLANSWDDLLESVGRVITNNETVRTALAGINELLVDNTGELNDNETANNLVSDAVIVLAKGLGLGASALDFFQKEVRDTRFLLDGLAIAVGYVYEGLQHIELATQKPLAWAGSEEAAKRVTEAGQALEEASAKIDRFKADQDQAKASSEAWSAKIAEFKGELDAFAVGLEETRGATHRNTEAAQENDAVWQQTTANLKAAEEARKKAADDAAAAEKKHAEALADLASYGTSWADTLSGMNSETILAVENALKLGASQTTIAEAMRLSEGQVKAVAASMKEADQAYKDFEKSQALVARMEADLQKIRGELSHDTTAAQIADVEAVKNANIKALDATTYATQKAYDLVNQVAQASTDLIVQKTLEADQFTHAHYAKLAAEAEEAYGFAMQHNEEYTGQALDSLRQVRDQTAETLANWEQAADASMQKVASSARGTAEAIGGVNEQFDALTGRIDSLAGRGGSIPGGGNNANVTPWYDTQAGRSQSYATMMLNKSYQESGLAYAPPGRADGGPVAAGETYVVGERGPELFRPKSSGTILPQSAAGDTHVVIEAGAFQLTYPIIDNPQALDALARTVGDAFMRRVTGSGGRM